MARTGRQKAYGDPEVGQRLRVFRRLHDLKQEDLAALWDTDRNVVGAYEAGRRRLPTDKARVLADRFRDLDLNWLLLGKGTAPGGELAQKVEELERRMRELQSSYSTAGQTEISDEVVEDFLHQLDLKDAIRDVTRLGSIRGAAEQQAFREVFGSLEPTLEQIVAEAAPRILRQFRDFVRKKRG